MPNLRLTDINLAESTAITPTTLIHIVTTADTSQNAAGSSYASTLSQVYDGLSGYCVPDLYVSNLHSCSPLYINPLSEGDVYIGSANTLTVDLLYERTGIGISSPTAKLHVVGSDSSSLNDGLKVQNSGGTDNFVVRNDGLISTTNLSGGTVSLKNNFETDIYNSYLSMTLPNNTYKMYFSEVGFGHWNYGSSNPNISPWDSQTLLHKNRGFEVVNYGGNSTFIRALGSSQLQQLCYDYNNNHIFLSTDFFHTKAVTGGATFFQVDQSGAGSGIVKVGIGAIPLSGATSTLDVTGATGYNQFRMRTSYTPTGNTDTNGNVGDVAWNDDFLYLKTNSGWGRIALDFVF